MLLLLYLNKALGRKTNKKNTTIIFAGRRKFSIWSQRKSHFCGYVIFERPLTKIYVIFAGRRKFSIWSQRKQSSTFMSRDTCCGDVAFKHAHAQEKVVTFNASQDGRYFVALHNHEVKMVLPKLKKKLDSFYFTIFGHISEFLSHSSQTF